MATEGLTIPVVAFISKCHSYPYVGRSRWGVIDTLFLTEHYGGSGGVVTCPSPHPPVDIQGGTAPHTHGNTGVGSTRPVATLLPP